MPKDHAVRFSCLTVNMPDAVLDIINVQFIVAM